MHGFIIFLLLYIVGFPLAATLGKKYSSVALKLTIGALSWIVAAGILSFTKNLASTLFMGIPWLPTAYLPLLMTIPFYLYQKPTKVWNEIARDFKPLLMIGVTAFVLSWISKPLPSQMFENQLVTITTSSLSPPYQGVEKREYPKITNYGAELLVSYMGVITHSPSKSYQAIYFLMLVCFLMILLETLEKIKIGWRVMMGLGLILLTLAARLVVFGDTLNWLIIIAGWLTQVQILKMKSVVLGGITLLGLLSINSGAALWWVIPSLLVIAPYELVLSVGIAILINPLVVGNIR